MKAAKTKKYKKQGGAKAPSCLCYGLMLFLAFKRGLHKAEEQRMRPIRAGLELRMILHAYVERPVGKLNRFNQPSVRRKAG